MPTLSPMVMAGMMTDVRLKRRRRPADVAVVGDVSPPRASPREWVKVTQHRQQQLCTKVSVDYSISTVISCI